ncbi:hypothetical protein EON65_03705 [archaeon]|nr:MAG: hypothetical protein EON65_03705 [archaeon]
MCIYQQRKRQERELDPVAMAYRDPAREDFYQKQKDDTIKKKVDFVNTMRSDKYDIVGHFGPPRKIDTMKHEYIPARSTHILTNLQYEDHINAPLLDDGTYALTKFRPNTVRAKTSIAQSREFNVISNEYKVNHDKRRLEDFEKLKTHLLKKYWDNHDYDMIKGRFYSPEKQKLYEEHLETIKSVQGTAQMERLPPSLKYSDGNSYNLLTHDVYDQEKLNSTLTVTNRSLNRVKKLQKEAEQKANGELEAQAKEHLHMNRIKFQRWEQQVDRGFNFITNQVVHETPAPLPCRPATMWARLTTHCDNYNDQFAATSISQSVDAAHNISKRGPFSGTRQVSDGPAGTAVPSARVRNLSGSGAMYVSTSLPAMNPDSARPPASSRKNMETSQVRSSKIPSLDLSKAEFSEPVRYQEPGQGAPPGLAIPIVRTGGLLSSHRVN